MRRSRHGHRLSIAAVGLVLVGATVTRADEHPDFTGRWTLNHVRSDDAGKVIREAAGSQYMQGRPDWAAETILPWGRKFSEGERVLLREVLLGAIRELETLELEQTPTTVTTIHGESGVRIFHLQRASAGTALVTGEKVTRRAEWVADTLVLKSTSGKTKTREVFSLTPARDQLTHVLHVEMDLLEHAIDLRLAYDRVHSSP